MSEAGAHALGALHQGEHDRGGGIAIELTAEVTDPLASRYGRWVKPVVDRVAAALTLLLLAPALAAVALVVLATLGRPLLIRQRRVGRGGRPFTMYKFRTMLPDRRQRPQPISHTERRRRHKTDDDPRHTRPGRLLRRYSLDELPQLWNILRGDMSLVGPRPELEHVVAGYDDWQHRRHEVKPGLTGLWQVTARAQADGDMHRHTHLDLDYIHRLSWRTDLRILLRTPLAAFGKGR